MFKRIRASFQRIGGWLRGERHYEVLLSYASDDRPYVEQVAKALREAGVNVFYDRFEEAEAWGMILRRFLADIYKNRGRFCVIFASAAYVANEWPMLEEEHALERQTNERAVKKDSAYILIARWYETVTLPGLNIDENVYVLLTLPDDTTSPELTNPEDSIRKNPKQLAKLIGKKVEKFRRVRRRHIAVAVAFAVALPFTIPAGYAVREFVEPDPTIKFEGATKDALTVSITNRLSRPLDLAGFQVLFKNVPIVKTELVLAGATQLHLEANDHIDLILKTKEYRLDTRCNKVESRHFVRNEIQDELASGHAILKIRTRDPSNPFWIPTAHSDPIPATVLSDFVLPRIPTRAPRTCS